MPALRCPREPNLASTEHGRPVFNTGARVDASREPSISGSTSGRFKLELLTNLNVTQCFSCKRNAIQVFDKIVWPATSSIITPQEDMPADVRADFLEAAAIVDSSPRGAAALLRLAVERLMPHLDAKAKNINASIGLLVAKGTRSEDTKGGRCLEGDRKRSSSSRPNDLKDDKTAALKLFDLVNIIVQASITAPKQIQCLTRPSAG
jgi:hypothetical protein